MTAPWTCTSPLGPERYRHMMRRAIFDCCKWHTQVEDRPVVCSYAMVLEEATWGYLAGLATELAKESLAAERELLQRPGLHDRLGLPAALRHGLRRISKLTPTPGAARVMRFDFHWTTEGFRITEGNTDVAGGFIEASGVTRLISEHYPDCRAPGDPAGVLAHSIVRAVGPGTRVGLMHLTTFSEDRQVMLYLARRMQDAGLATCLFSPEQLHWDNGEANVSTAWYTGPVQLVLRFFPAEWLPRLGWRTTWQHFLAGGRTAICNPAYAVLTQSKRFPLVWEELSAALPTWRSLLPETRRPRADSSLETAWVLKPALGHEGQDVALHGVCRQEDWEHIQAAALKNSERWAMQRRFEALALDTPDGPRFPCVGVYVIDGQVAGAYARMSVRPLIDGNSQDVAVLVRTGGAKRIGRDSVDGEKLFAVWAPPGGVWSLWARPVLFAQMPADPRPPAQRATGNQVAISGLNVGWAPNAAEGIVVVIDLPGAQSLWMGLALAGKGYRPVPLYNGCTGPHEVIDQGSILEGLRAGADYLASLTLTDASPAFLVDSQRMKPTRKIEPGDFDNRWQVFCQDFPSAAFLIDRGLKRAILIQEGRRLPQDDLAHVLRRWQDAGIQIETKDMANQAAPEPIRIEWPPWYRSLWQRLRAIFSLHRNPAGGFGGIVPKPSHG